MFFFEAMLAQVLGDKTRERKLTKNVTAFQAFLHFKISKNPTVNKQRNFSKTVISIREDFHISYGDSHKETSIKIILVLPKKQKEENETKRLKNL